MLTLVEQKNSQSLYDYYCENIVGEAPYYHQVSKKIWDESFFEDTDYEGDKKYRELVTYSSLAKDGTVNGFIQFGLSNYGYDEEGEKSFEQSMGLVRQIYFLNNQPEVGAELLAAAIRYFRENELELSYAFFHALGMTCTGNHGKLHDSMPDVAELLLDNGFSVEHTNVYYVKKLEATVETKTLSLTVKSTGKTENQTQMFTFYQGEQAIGQANVAFLTENTIAYLRWIFMLDEYQNKGFGTQALQLLFAFLSLEGMTELHTDTADTNECAQHVYEKNGFEHSGLTRSYQIL